MAPSQNSQLQRFEANIHDVFSFTRAEYLINDDGDFDLYTLRFIDPQYQITKSAQHDRGDHRRLKPAVAPILVAYSDHFMRGTFSSHISYLHFVYPAGKQLTHKVLNTDITVNQVPGQMNALRFRQERDVPDNWVANTYWVLTDQHGTEYKIQFTSEDNANLIGIARYPD